MARGRKPTPTKVLEMRGSWKARTRPDEPQVAALSPTCPPWVEGEAKKIWTLLLRALKPTGMLTRADQFALGRYCVYMAQWLAVTAFLRDHGETYLSEKHGWSIPLLYPQARLSLQLADRLLHLEHQFGLTPLARAAIGIALAKGSVRDNGLDLSDPKRFLKLG